MKAIKKVLGIIGSQAELARQLNVSPQFINQVCKEGRPMPSIHCRKIKHLTQGRVMEWELRPDVFDPPPIATAEKAA
jgi:DNA-binding transcriptional regulator YdaS (Cro superfamily)